MARIPLFDIDKTLVTGANRTHLDAFDAALEAVYQLRGVTVREIDMHGKVDTQILLEVLARHEVPRSLALEGVAEAFQHMIGYYQTHLPTGDVALLPGVRELLEELRSREVPLGLLTGNVEAIAHHKLASLHIDHFFSFGGFGDMAEARSALFEPALRRAQQLGLNCTLETFLAFGDTPLDIQAAQQAGVAAIGVATGDYTQAQLKEVGAEATVAGLADRTRVIELLELVVR